jgi:hypothetical protein
MIASAESAVQAPDAVAVEAMIRVEVGIAVLAIAAFIAWEKFFMQTVVAPPPHVSCEPSFAPPSIKATLGMLGNAAQLANTCLAIRGAVEPLIA